MLTRLGLSIPGTRQAVPLRDWSSGAILDAILTDDIAIRTRVLSQLLSVDAALWLWLLNLQPNIASWSEVNVDQLSRWSADRLPELIAAHVIHPRISEELASHHATTQLNAVRTARLARILAAKENGDQQEIAYACGLLSTASEWICDVHDGDFYRSRDSQSRSLPGWLRLGLRQVSSKDSHAIPFLSNVREAISSLSRSRNEHERLISLSERRLWDTEFPLIQSLFVKVLALNGDFKRSQRNFQDRLQSEKLAAMKELAYGASHEINNPLTNIATRAQTLIRDESDPERRRQLATISSQAFRAHEMIADMMLFAKPPQSKRQILDIAEFLRGRVSSFRSDLDLNRAKIELAIEDQNLWTFADPTQLDVALRAVVKNGIEASVGNPVVVVMARHREVSMSASSELKWTVEIEVRDSGQGLSAEATRHLFDPFYSGREAHRGHGFGLSKAWRIIEQHEGGIVVTSKPGVETSFFLRLPAVDSP